MSCVLRKFLCVVVLVVVLLVVVVVFDFVELSSVELMS